MTYLDYAATTPICEAAKKAIIEHLDYFGNPSSSYDLGHKSKILIEDARAKIAECIHAEPDEIYFTSGGSEANSWVINGRIRSLASSIEHHSINPTYKFSVEDTGIADVKCVDKVLNIYTPARILSCMTVNNEIGTIQPIKELAKIAHKNNILFHTDAVQAVGHIPIDVNYIGCDMLSASGHKFGAPKGVGFLYVKDKVAPPSSIIYGGKQERGFRGGTENVLGIIAMAAALEDAVNNMVFRNTYLWELRSKLIESLLDVEGIHINGSFNDRVVSNINIRIDGVKGEDVVAMADHYGIYISSGSACNEGNAKPSHVLKAIGLTDEEALSSIRITLGHQNTFEEIELACDILPKIIERLRAF